NNKVRNKLIQKSKLKKFEEGDILMLNDYYYEKQDSKSNDEETKSHSLYTSDRIIVLSVSCIIMPKSNFDNFKLTYDTNNKYLGRVALQEYNLLISNLLSIYTKSNYKCWKLNVVKMNNK